MAATRDASSSASGAGVSSLTWSHTCSGADRLLGVGVGFWDSSADVSGVTYAGAALTKIGEATRVMAEAHQWRRIAPATGANNIVVTLVAAGDLSCGGQSFSSVDQTTPLGTQAVATGSSTAPTVNVSAATDDLVWDTLGGDDGTNTIGADQTSSWNITGGTVPNGAGSTEPGAATVTMSWTFGSTGSWAICGVAVKAAAGGAATWGPLIGLQNNRLVVEAG